MSIVMQGVMLTSFKNNPAATAFYLEKLKYTIDPISPSYVNPLGKPSPDRTVEGGRLTWTLQLPTSTRMRS